MVSSFLTGLRPSGCVKPRFAAKSRKFQTSHAESLLLEPKSTHAVEKEPVVALLRLRSSQSQSSFSAPPPAGTTSAMSRGSRKKRRSFSREEKTHRRRTVVGQCVTFVRPCREYLVPWFSAVLCCAVLYCASRGGGVEEWNEGTLSLQNDDMGNMANMGTATAEPEGGRTKDQGPDGKTNRQLPVSDLKNSSTQY